MDALQRQYFEASIKKDAVFAVIKGEADRIRHGDDSWAMHPMIPTAMVDRFVDAGHDWDAAVFDENWPDGAFAGRTVGEVMNSCWTTVSGWLDEIDARDEHSTA